MHSCGLSLKALSIFSCRYNFVSDLTNTGRLEEVTFRIYKVRRGIDTPRQETVRAFNLVIKQYRLFVFNVPEVEENGHQGFGCLHHVVVLLSKKQREEGAAVGDR